jgi:uncharacterized membrane protein
MLSGAWFESIVVIVEIVGVVALCAGFVIAGVLAVRALMRREGGHAAYQTLRTTIGGSILLGLEIFVAADIIRTISTPTLQDALVLGLIVVIRTVLSMSIQIEIDGIAPWRRAMFMSGGQVIAGQIAKGKPADEAV